MSIQARRRRQRHSRGGPGKVVTIGAVALVVAIVLGIAGLGTYVLAIASTVPKLAGRKAIVSGASSQVFAANGERLGFIQSDVLRTPVSRQETPLLLRDATVSIEDQRFYKDDGIDPTGIVRSAVRDAVTGEALQGGSTITMQLVRNLYLGNDVKTVKQKIAEAKLALEYNKAHSKSAILTQYLNTVPYGTVEGQTTLGVQAASRVFFDKPVNKLDLEQCALLAGLPQAPSQYNPLLYPKVATKRRNEVLSKMAELHYITQQEAVETKAEGLQLRRGYYYEHRRENFFFEYVRQLLVKKYGQKTVDRGGLKVYTTLNLHMQELAHNAISEVLDDPGDPASAIVTMNPHNGYIEAMAQSQSYSKLQYNLAVEGHRQAGSTFKAIDLADALSRGVDPNSTYYISHTLEPGWLEGYPTYEVKTFEDTSLDKPINLVEATLSSDNTVYAQLAADLGEETISEMAHKMGVHAKLYNYPSEALGGLRIGVSPLEMADVYSTLADGGYRNKPIAITKVEFPNKHVDTSWGKPHRVKVLSDGVTSEEEKILEENVEAGTATRSKISCPTAAKTGTTSEFVDAWLDGYTPEFATVVWMGYPSGAVPMLDVHGEVQQGGALPADIWHAYMEPVVDGNCVPFPEPTEPLVYKPFYGQFAEQGESAETAPPVTETGTPGEHGRKHGGASTPGGATAPGEEPTEPGEESTVEQTPEQAPTPGGGAPQAGGGAPAPGGGAASP
ncbi:MAG TPA: transglycosylase domain-containing protein [Solirubrobacteraceae bacterium]|jgi:penicillin-binding protein 1A